MTKKNNQLLMLLSAAGLLAFTACADDKYDLSDLDTTIGIGSDDGLTLPTISTKEIFLKDVLDLDGTDNVVLNSDSDYVFQQIGDAVADVHPTIDKIVLNSERLQYSPEVTLYKSENGIGLPGGLLTEDYEIPGSANNDIVDIYSFEYTFDKPEGINKLTDIDIEGGFDITLNLKGLDGLTLNFTTFELEFPDYLVISSKTEDGKIEGNRLKVTNIGQKQEINIKVDITKLKIADEIGQKTLSMDGDIKLHIAWDNIIIKKDIKEIPKEIGFQCNIEMSHVAITGATGSYSPKFTMDDLGSVEIGNLPDFLTGEDVKLDLYNPQIVVNIKSDMSVPGYLTGTLTAVRKDGGEPIVVNISKLRINSVEENNGESNIMICRQEMDFSNYTDYQVVPELATIIEALPNVESISFGAEAGAESSAEDSKIELGREYTITPSYRIEAPIAFGDNACIAYADTLDGWNDDVQDIEFADKAYIQVEADITNRIPADLTLSAHAIGLNGQEIDGLKVEVTSDIKGTKDPNQPVTSHISILIKQEKANALKAVDGITLDVKAASTPEIAGITLNAKKHSLKVDNIKVTLKGKIVIKTDD